MSGLKIRKIIFSKFSQCFPLKSFTKSLKVVFTGVFTCQRLTGEDAGRAAYSLLRLHVTGEYNHQQAGISSQTTEYVARYPVYTQRVHLYSRTRSQKLELLSV